MKRIDFVFPGTKNDQITSREIAHRKIARKAAAEGIVLLKNEGALPLAPKSTVALFGVGANHMVKGGTGSGDVNEREVVQPATAFREAGFKLSSEAWLSDYEAEYGQVYGEYVQNLGAKLSKMNEPKKEGEDGPDGMAEIIMEILDTAFDYPKGRDILVDDLGEADTAVYIITRIAGEGSDRFNRPGEYQLAEKEVEQIKCLSESTAKLVVVINSGYPLDLSFMDDYQIDALVSLSQPGMEGGSALVDVLSAAVVPSGKLTDTLAYNYMDYPNSETFSHNNNDVNDEYYTEGIYVGYRYFDTFSVATRYQFGYGLSYTEFEMGSKTLSLSYEEGKDPQVKVAVDVKNIGDTYGGKEVVQVYASAPEGNLKKEFKRLCAFDKTAVLEPGGSTRVEISFGLDRLASYDEATSEYVLEAGDYKIAISNSGKVEKADIVLHIPERTVLVAAQAISPVQKPFTELQYEVRPIMAADDAAVITLDVKKVQTKTIQYNYENSVLDTKSEAYNLVNQMNEEELIAFCCGQEGEGEGMMSIFGAAGQLVPGAAGQTSKMGKPYDISEIIVADGPAGLRLKKHYDVKDGKILSGHPLAALNPVFADLMPEERPEGVETYHQYCTAIPVGTSLAQTWNRDLVKAVGEAIAIEMEEFEVTLWLAPGMNIHRNPLCGRNFEYYSEDPVLSGEIAAAMTLGVQTVPGTGTTIKHYACNNQEDNRFGSDSIISERALREIYLKNFEVTVKQSQPMALMSSYNLINGIHAANNTDLLSRVLRDEWGFKGLVMTDWTTTNSSIPNCSEPAICVKSGNDLIMPGTPEDKDRIKKGLEDGTISLEDVKRCVTNVVDITLCSSRYEGAKPYNRLG